METADLNNIYNNLSYIFNKLPRPGLLLISGNNIEKSNVMTIGWLSFGILWGFPTISIYIRPTRFTHQLLLKYNEFSINLLPNSFNNSLNICGTKSGSYCNKFEESKLQTVKSEKINCLSLKNALLTIECKIIHSNEVKTENLNDLLNARFYSNNDYHTIFIGQILNFRNVHNIHISFND